MMIRDKRIIHVSAWAEVFWHFRMPLLRKQREQFRKVILYCSDRQYCKSKDIAYSESGHIRKMIDSGFDVRVGKIGNKPKIDLLKNIYDLAKLLKREKIDIVMAHQPMGGLVGIPAAILARVPLRIYSTGGLKYIPGDQKISNKIMQYAESLIIRMSSAVFVVNREDEKELNYQSFAKNKVYYVGPSGGCGINTDEYNPKYMNVFREKSRNELKFNNNDIVVGYVGRCVWEKGFKEMIDAASKLKERNSNKKIIFLIVGEGLDLPNIKKIILSKGLDSYFKFTGYRYDVKYCMSAFDFFLLPSHREGLPISLLQAMALGIPSIATNIRGNRELINHMNNGILIKRGSSSEIVEAIMKLHDCEILSKTLSAEATKNISENYGEDKMIARTSNIIHELVNRSFAFDEDM